MFGIPFIILGNLSGNAIAFGMYMMHVCTGDEKPSRGSVTGWAILGLTLPIALNGFSRKGGLLLNNTLAVTKVAILLVIAASHRLRQRQGRKGRPRELQDRPFVLAAER